MGGPLHIKSWFNQPGKKKSRRLKRAAKAAANAPRPADKLRPLVRCQTQQHNAKVRLGRGFSLAELREDLAQVRRDRRDCRGPPEDEQVARSVGHQRATLDG